MNDAMAFVGFLALLAVIAGGFIGVAMGIAHLVMVGLSTVA